MNESFSVIFIFVIVPILSISTIIISVFSAKKREKKLFHVGVMYLKNLRTLLMHIQQHRGLTSSYLNGNTHVSAEIERLEDIAKKEIIKLEDIDAWLILNPKWESLIDHWSRLAVNYKNSEPENNLKQHNNLIANLLYLIDDVAYTHQLGALGVVNTTDSDWRHLLSLAEYIGQARALGVGAISRGECSTILRNQLHHLRKKIESNLNLNWGDVVKNDFNLFLTAINEQVITEKIRISSSDYFELATECIKHVLLEFDAQVEKMQFQKKLNQKLY